MSLGGTNFGFGQPIVNNVVNAAVIVKSICVITPPPIEVEITIECP